MASSDSLRHQILDLLLDGPVSFAALVKALARYSRSPRAMDVDAVMESLESMEHAGWIQTHKLNADGSINRPTAADRMGARDAYREWLPSALDSDLSFDHVGLWYEIRPQGREEWKHWTQKDQESGVARWTLDEDAASRTIAVSAENGSVAEQALNEWLEHHPEIEIVSGTKALEALPSFSLRDGTIVRDGVKLMCRYASRAVPPGSHLES